MIISNPVLIQSKELPMFGSINSVRMKSTKSYFGIHVACGKARAGQLELANGKLNTPAALLQTQFGQPSHMVEHVLMSLPPKLVQCAAIRYPHFFGHENLVARAIEQGKSTSLSSYCNLGDRLTVMLLRDPSRWPTPEASNDSVNIDSWGGRRKVHVNDYIESVRKMRPDLAVTLNDEVGPATGKKRTRMSVDRAVDWANKIVTASSEQDVEESNQFPPLLCYVPCVPDKIVRREAVTKIVSASGLNDDGTESKKGAVAGFALGGLGLGESPELRREILDDVVEVLPSHAIRLVTGLNSPIEMLDAISQGVDIIDADYAELLSKWGYAASFQYVMPGLEQEIAEEMSASQLPVSSAPTSEGDDGLVNVSVQGSRPGYGGKEVTPEVVPSPDNLKAGATIKGFSGDRKLAEETTKREGSALLTDRSKLNLRDTKFAGDLRPLVDGCACYACQGVKHYGSNIDDLGKTKDGRPLVQPGHTRGYIHHLLDAHEMLGSVLLDIHNVYHVSAFLAAIRAAIKAQKLNEYSQWFRSVNKMC